MESLWRLTKLPYGIVEAGKQRKKTIEKGMLTEGGLETVFGLSQLFIKRSLAGKVVLLVVKVTDDFLMGRHKVKIETFIERMRRPFDVGRSLIDKSFYYDGCEIHQDVYGNITMSMKIYV